ncbi:hypothetical protein JCM31271_19070 [Halorubrum trueperi]
MLTVALRDERVPRYRFDRRQHAFTHVEPATELIDQLSPGVLAIGVVHALV